MEVAELPEGENPWGDTRYFTVVLLPDPATGRFLGFKVHRVHILYLRNRYIEASGLLDGLSSKARMTAWTLCEMLLERQKMLKTPQEDFYRNLLSDHSHLQAQLRQLSKAMRERLEERKSQFKGLREILLAGRLGKAFDKAIDALGELEKQAGDACTVRGLESDSKTVLNAGWIFDRPAIAYALRKLLREHADRPIECGEIHRRIAFFENRFLRCNVDGLGNSVRREISRFEENHERVQVMDHLLRELLTGNWYTWPLQQEGDSTSRPSSRNKKAKPQPGPDPALGQE